MAKTKVVPSSELNPEKSLRASDYVDQEPTPSENPLRAPDPEGPMNPAPSVEEPPAQEESAAPAPVEPPMARDKPPAVKFTVEFDSSSPEFRHEIQVGRKVVALTPAGDVLGDVISRDNARVALSVKGARVNVAITDIVKIKR